MIKSVFARGKKLLLPFPFPSYPAAVGFTPIKEGITPSPEQNCHKLPPHSTAALQNTSFCLEVDLNFPGLFVFSAGDGVGTFPSPSWPWQCGVAEAGCDHQDSRSGGKGGGEVSAGGMDGDREQRRLPAPSCSCSSLVSADLSVP